MAGHTQLHFCRSRLFQGKPICFQICLSHALRLALIAPGDKHSIPGGIFSQQYSPAFGTSDRIIDSALPSQVTEQLCSRCAGIFPSTVHSAVTPSPPGNAASGQRSRYCFAVG